MNVHSRIISVDSNNHSMVIRYWTDLITENSLAVAFDNNGRIIMDSNGYPSRCLTDVNYTFTFHPNPSSNDINVILKSVAPVPSLFLREQIESGNLQYDLTNVIQEIGTESVFEANTDLFIPKNIKF
jgi:hypothetical protein